MSWSESPWPYMKTHEPIFSSSFLVAFMPKITRYQFEILKPEPLRFTSAQTSTTQTSCQSQENPKVKNLQNFDAILCNPWISSAMAMAMSIYRTLCVLVFSKISLLEMPISFGNEHLTSKWSPMTTPWPPTDLPEPLIFLPWPSTDLPLTSYYLPLNSHDLSGLFIFWSFFFFFPENFTLRDAHCFWQWASKKDWWLDSKVETSWKSSRDLPYPR